MESATVTRTGGMPDLPRYLPALRDFLREHERELWDWFASNRVRTEHADAVRLDLLKRTYRLDRTDHEPLYAAAGRVARQLGLDVPVTLYQAQCDSGTNVSLAYIPGEAHIIVHGNVSALLDEAEWRAVLGHELGHFALLDGFDGHYLAVAELLTAVSHDSNASPAYLESARLLALYTEIACDRAALDTTGELAPAVTSLVKLLTGLNAVSADSYMRQAREVLDRGPIRTQELDHPEAFIRARALQLYADRPDDLEQRVAEMIEGELELARLDLLGQRKLSGLTRRLIDRTLAEPWMQGDAHVAHARMFFDGYKPPAADFRDDDLAGDLPAGDAALRDYWAYVLLDFVAADRSRSDAALAWALDLAEELALSDRFRAAAAKELRVTQKLLDETWRDRQKLIAAARVELADDGEDA